jgi:cytochrome b involved in lipid metabolism
MNTQKKIFTLITVLVTIAIAVIFIFGSKSEDMSITTTVPTVATTTLPTYTTTDVSLHATSTDCWSIVNGHVYDLTSYIDQHPGGKKAVMQTCGIDASNAFNGKHGGKKRPANELEKHLIGNLKI